MIFVSHGNDRQNVVVLDEELEYFDEHRFVVGKTKGHIYDVGTVLDRPLNAFDQRA